ncbi:MAG: L,D-transpeptidase family protein [Bacteroidota bacterium]
MKKILHIALVAVMFTMLSHAQLTSAQKLIITVTDDWNSNKGTMYLFDKTKQGWKKQRGEISVSIGENGLGWGIGLNSAQPGGYVKKEGDRRSPAGIFELDSLFYGLGPTAPEDVRFPYLPLTSRSVCVDDTASVNYNRVFEGDTSKKDWSSAEHMDRVDPDYKYVLVIRHNAQREKGKGSCIFIHINNVPTSGCTSMDEEDMLTVLRWLDTKRKTLVIQLPHSEYHRLKSEWNLPMLLNN